MKYGYIFIMMEKGGLTAKKIGSLHFDTQIKNYRNSVFTTWEQALK